jgi:ribosomal 30S subunit maturation factor RimM
LEIGTPKGSVLLPMVDVFVLSVDVANGIIVVSLPEGM